MPSDQSQPRRTPPPATVVTVPTPGSKTGPTRNAEPPPASEPAAAPEALAEVDDALADEADKLLAEDSAIAHTHEDAIEPLVPEEPEEQPVDSEKPVEHAAGEADDSPAAPEPLAEAPGEPESAAAETDFDVAEVAEPEHEVSAQEDESPAEATVVHSDSADAADPEQRASAPSAPTAPSAAPSADRPVAAGRPMRATVDPPAPTRQRTNRFTGSLVSVQALALAGLTAISFPMRFVPESMRSLVDWFALSLLFWVPAVWIIVLFFVGE